MHAEKVARQESSIFELRSDALERVALDCEANTLLAMRGVCREWHALASTDYLWIERLSELLVKYPSVPARIGVSPPMGMYFEARRLADFEDTRYSGYVARAYPHLSRYGQVRAPGLPGAEFVPHVEGQKLVLQGVDYGTVLEAVDLFEAAGASRFTKAAQLFVGLANNLRVGMKHVWGICHPQKGLKAGALEVLLCQRYGGAGSSAVELAAVGAEADALARKKHGAHLDAPRTPGLDSRARTWQRRYLRSESRTLELQAMVQKLERSLEASEAVVCAQTKLIRSQEKELAELRGRSSTAEVQELREEVRRAQREVRLRDRIISSLGAQILKGEKAVATAVAKEVRAKEALQKVRRESGEAQAAAEEAQAAAERKALEADMAARLAREQEEAALQQLRSHESCISELKARLEAAGQEAAASKESMAQRVSRERDAGSYSQDTERAFSIRAADLPLNTSYTCLSTREQGGGCGVSLFRFARANKASGVARRQTATNRSNAVNGFLRVQSAPARADEEQVQAAMRKQLGHLAHAKKGMWRAAAKEAGVSFTAEVSFKSVKAMAPHISGNLLRGFLAQLRSDGIKVRESIEFPSP